MRTNETQTAFSYSYPLKHKVVENMKIVTEHVGDLQIEGVGYISQSPHRFDIFDRYSVDIAFVKWNGADIKPVLEVIGGMDEIIEATIRYFANENEAQGGLK